MGLRSVSGASGSDALGCGHAQLRSETELRISTELRMNDAAELAARELARLGAEERAGLFHLSWWSDRLLGMAMGDAGFRAELLRFVDVYPATAGPEDVVEHLRAYLGDRPPPDRCARWSAWQGRCR